MELIAKGSFFRDLSAYSDKVILREITEVMAKITSSKDISQIQNLKKLKEYKTLYRIKIAEDYRLGIVVRGNKIWLVKFSHRSNFYKNFP
jgi:mRNA interferase RelE/StbE